MTTRDNSLGYTTVVAPGLVTEAARLTAGGLALEAGLEPARAWAAGRVAAAAAGAEAAMAALAAAAVAATAARGPRVPAGGGRRAFAGNQAPLMLP